MDRHLPGRHLKPERKAYSNAWHRANGWRYRNSLLTQDEYEQMIIAQDGKCAICGTTDFKGQGNKLHIDHNHDTGKVRGLLCHSCNTGMGSLGDSPEMLREAAAYLESRN